MSSKGVQDRVFACAPTMWVAFAYSELVAEAIRRLRPDLAKPAPGVVVSEPMVGKSLLAECEAPEASLTAIDLRESEEKHVISVRGAVEGLKGWLAGIGRAVLGRKE